MAACLLVSSGWSFFALALVFLGSTAVLARRQAPRPLYAGLGARFFNCTLTILPRLWVMQASRYSILAPLNPPRINFRNPKGPLICPNTGSTITLRLL